jgi:hypothetical protein
VLSEYGEDGEALVLPTVHLASSFPALRTLVLRCGMKAAEGWLERFAAFVTRNRGALQQLRHLDLGGCEDEAAAPPFTSGTLDALALLPALQSLQAEVGERLDPSSWSVLAGLTQLTALRLALCSGSYEQHLQQIVVAAPQLQELWVDFFGSVPGKIACLTGLRSLSSLHLHIKEQDAQAPRSFTALQRLTHLGLNLGSRKMLDEMMAVTHLTSLASLVLEGHELDNAMPVAHLATLQQLTSLILIGRDYLGQDEALALASLGQRRRLQADFGSPAAAAAAGLARLEECKVLVGGRHGGEPVLLAGRVELWSLEGYDLSRVHTLSLSLADGHSVLQRAAALQAVAALPQLEHLNLHYIDLLDHPSLWSPQSSSQPDASTMAVLLTGCRQLKQLTLVGMTGLQEGTVVALMMLPRLRLLRLLGCSLGLSQERCQAQLRLCELQVDVVVGDGLARARWMMINLGAIWGVWRAAK